MNTKFVQIEIGDHDSLMKACDLLHDARCDLSALKQDQGIGSWKASFEREFLEDPDLIHSARRLFIFTKYTFPLISSRLTLQDVAFYEIEDRSKIGTYIFDECRLNGDVYEFRFCEDMRMIFRFHDEPHGELRDMDLLPKKGTFFTFRNPFQTKTCAPRGVR
jgi:hypothetical protein